MAVSLRHVLEQGPMLRALGSAALSTLRRHDGPKPAAPGPWVSAQVRAPSPELVRAFVRWAGGDASTYRDRLPPHFFPQWSLPLASQALAGLPYPLARVLNAGCRIEVRAPLPVDEALDVRARLESLDDNGERARITTRIVTGTASRPDALVADIHAFVPLARAKPGARAGRERTAATVPVDAHELAYTRLSARAGLDFAKLTGDFNPIHWIPAAAHAAGFRAVILHGFGTFALAVEALIRRTLSGEASALSSVEARFTRPLALPCRVGVYRSEARRAEAGLFVGAAPGAMAQLVGTYTTRGESQR